MSGTFDKLNDALFAQMDKLQSIDPRDREQMELCIEQTKTVSQLASNIISNAATAVKAMEAYERAGVGIGDVAAKAPKLLGYGE